MKPGERPLYTRLIPVLPVADVLAEREFYERLGFSHFVDPASADSRLWWQVETVDVWPIHERARHANLEIEQPPQIEPWGRRTLKLRSPNGYVVTFEEMEK